MKKYAFMACFMLFLNSCSFFRSQITTYPEGIFFPVERDGELIYQGEVIDNVEKDGANLYFSTKEGFVYCIDSFERKISWQFDASKNLVSPAYLGSEHIYVYSSENVLCCLDRKGGLIWQKKIDGEITSGVGEYNDRIYLGTANGDFLSLDPATGEELWSFQAGSAIRSKPVSSENMVVFGCDDNHLYFLTEKGTLIDRFAANDKIQAPVLVDDNLLFFCSDDHYFYCLDLDKRKKKWKIKIGGQVSSPPVSDRKRVYFLCWNSVLYCLNKRNGTILWWKAIPSRSFYHLELIASNIAVSSLSSRLICFDVESGKMVGSFDARQEIKSNPAWLEPFLAINLYDHRENTGRLVFLKKVVEISLSSSKGSPQKINEEIVFKTSVLGFFRPKFEFFVKEDEKKMVVQEKSEKNVWAWFPEKEGTYVIGVRVDDGKETGESEMGFVIIK